MGMEHTDGQTDGSQHRFNAPYCRRRAQ